MSNFEGNLNIATANLAGLTLEEEEILVKVLEALRQINFGYIQLTIQDGRVIQLDRTEKQRFSGRR
jgi:hypothetical protein